MHVVPDVDGLVEVVDVASELPRGNEAKSPPTLIVVEGVLETNISLASLERHASGKLVASNVRLLGSGHIIDGSLNLGERLVLGSIGVDLSDDRSDLAADSRVELTEQSESGKHVSSLPPVRAVGIVVEETGVTVEPSEKLIPIKEKSVSGEKHYIESLLCIEDILVASSVLVIRRSIGLHKSSARGGGDSQLREMHDEYDIRYV